MRSLLYTEVLDVNEIKVHMSRVIAELHAGIGPGAGLDWIPGLCDLYH